MQQDIVDIMDFLDFDAAPPALGMEALTTLGAGDDLETWLSGGLNGTIDLPPLPSPPRSTESPATSLLSPPSDHLTQPSTSVSPALFPLPDIFEDLPENDLISSLWGNEPTAASLPPEPSKALVADALPGAALLTENVDAGSPLSAEVCRKILAAPVKRKPGRKRKSELALAGQTEPNESEARSSMTAEEKKEDRMKKNRDAASESRRRRVERQLAVENLAATLAAENEQLRASLAAAKSSIASLEAQNAALTAALGARPMPPLPPKERILVTKDIDQELPNRKRARRALDATLSTFPPSPSLLLDDTPESSPVPRASMTAALSLFMFSFLFFLFPNGRPTASSLHQISSAPHVHAPSHVLPPAAIVEKPLLDAPPQPLLLPPSTDELFLRNLLVVPPSWTPSPDASQLSIALSALPLLLGDSASEVWIDGGRGCGNAGPHMFLLKDIDPVWAAGAERAVLRLEVEVVGARLIRWNETNVDVTASDLGVVPRQTADVVWLTAPEIGSQ